MRLTPAAWIILGGEVAALGLGGLALYGIATGRNRLIATGTVGVVALGLILSRLGKVVRPADLVDGG